MVVGVMLFLRFADGTVDALVVRDDVEIAAEVAEVGLAELWKQKFI